MAYEKIDSRRFKQSKTVEEVHDIYEVERMITVWENQIKNATAELDKWKALKTEAEKLGITGMKEE